MPDASSPRKRGRYFVRDSLFVKEFSNDVDIEFEKAIQIHRVSQDSGLFDAPKPLSCEPTRAQITYELMAEPVVSIRNLYIDYLSSTNVAALAECLFQKIGRALALIHKNLDLNSSSAWVHPGAVGKAVHPSQSAWVFLHCDFGFSNIFLKKNALDSGNDLELWIIDPSPNYFMTYYANTIGPAEVDIANLIACMHGLFPLRSQFRCDWDSSFVLVDKLIDGYERESSRSVDQSYLRRLVEITLAAYLEQRVPTLFIRRLALRLLRSKRRTAGLYRDEL